MHVRSFVKLHGLERRWAPTKNLLTRLSECNIPSSNACICHMSTTTLGITVILEQTEKKKKLMLNETLTQLSWVETHLHEKTNAREHQWRIQTFR